MENGKWKVENSSSFSSVPCRLKKSDWQLALSFWLKTKKPLKTSITSSKKN